MERMTKEMVKLREENRRLSQESKKGADDAKGGWDGAALSIGKMATSYLSVHAALQLINSELERKKRLEKESADAQVSVSAARQELIANLPGASRGDISRTLGDVSAIARDARVDEAIIAKTVAQTLSASGGNRAVAVNAARIASQFLSHDPTAIPEFGGAMTDISKVTGSSDMMLNLGAFAQAGATSRVVDPKKLATAAPSAAIGMKSFGATAQEGISFWSALTSAAADDEGRLSATGSISFAEQLREFLPPGGVAAKTTGTGSGRKREAARPGFGSFGERLEFLQQNPEMAKSFADTLEGEKRVKGPLEDLLLRPESFMAQQYQKNLRAFPDDAGLRKLGGDVLANKQIDPLFGVSELGRSGESYLQRSRVSNVAGGERAQIRELVRSQLEQSGNFGPGTWATMMGFDLGTLPGGTDEERGARVLEGRAKVLQTTQGESAKESIVLLREIAAELRKGNAKKAVPVRQE